MSEIDAPSEVDAAAEADAPVELDAPVEMTESAPPSNSNDGYAFAAIICAIAGFVIPVLPAAAALLLVRAVEPPFVDEPLSPAAARLASTAQTLAYISLTIIVAVCAAFLLGILGRSFR